MATYTCPDGHQSNASDYCDVCGAPIAATPSTGTAPGATNSLSLDPPAGTKACPSCGDANLSTAQFCEICGYDFVSGKPAVAAATSGPTIEWVVEVWVDPDWYDRNKSMATMDDPCPPAGMPEVVPLLGATAFIGRASKSRGTPEIDCAGDGSVSHRHAQLDLLSGDWFVTDLQSTNGTFCAPAGAPLPTDPIVPGQRQAVTENDRLYLGGWTRLVVRKATAAEQTA